MSKQRISYVCQQCGAQALKWSGQCTDCSSWNSLVEEIGSASHQRHDAGAHIPSVQIMRDITPDVLTRKTTGFAELDRVLGGGLVSGSVTLIGGDPGIGKSTLLLQAICRLSQQETALYVTGEESLQQVTLRAQRLGVSGAALKLLADTHVERIIQVATHEQCQTVVIDSIQTLHTDTVTSAPGSVSQVRESAAQLVAFAKQANMALFIIGHVTKEGALAGPRVLEHMVDTVLYFESQHHSRFRVIRAVKNRFGAVNELAVFAMTDRGLRGVDNPSEIFLSRYQAPVSGSVAMVTWEGSRPLLLEVQALVDQSHLANPRRVCVGLEANRLAMLLAVLHKHGHIACYDQDVFANIVGGMRVSETGADLAILCAIVSSFRNKPLPLDLVVFGEVGLSGEIRPVQSGQERLQAAYKQGFKRAIIPLANAPKKPMQGMAISAVKSLVSALESLAYDEGHMRSLA